MTDSEFPVRISPVLMDNSVIKLSSDDFTVDQLNLLAHVRSVFDGWRGQNGP